MATMTPKELAHMIFQPGKTDAKAVVTKFSITFDFGTFTKRVTWNAKEDEMRSVEQAKRGHCLAKDRGEPDPVPPDA